MEQSIIIFIIVGFIAQLIDGTIGMGYGVCSTSFLLSVGLPPAAASASVHVSEVFVTGASGLSHLKHGNVDRKIVLSLIIPGAIGGILGAYVLTQVPGDRIKPFVAVYLLIMGVVILRKALRKTPPSEGKIRIVPLGLTGGFLDAIGGGGWGPIVASTLVANGKTPRFAIGSVNLAEFFVTVAQATTFVTLLGSVHWRIVVGLLIGGVAAAPLAAIFCKRLPTPALMKMVGTMVIILSLRAIYQAMF